MYVCVGRLHQIEEEEEAPAATSIRIDTQFQY